MVTYKERISKSKYYVINKENVTIGLYTGLRKMCEEMKEIDSNFPSYWTLVKLDKTKPIKVKKYIIQEMKLITGNR